MNFIRALAESALVAAALLAAAADGAALLTFDGKAVLSRAEAESRIPAELSGEARRQALEKMALDRARDQVAQLLLERAGITPDEVKTREYLRGAIDKLPPAERARFESELASRGETVENYIARNSKLPEQRFRAACVEWVIRDFDSKIKVSEPEMQEFYAANPGLFRVPAERKAALIAMPRSDANDTAAAAVAAQLEQGERFDLLKSRYSTADDKTLERLRADSAVIAAVQKLAPDGQVAIVVLTAEYAVVVKLAQYRPERLLSFQEAKPTLERSLRDLKVRTAVNSAISAEAARHKIEINTGDDAIK
ncbi:MAG: peptidyl-prolyl cis-trans isomerase [Victivallaceae bacterium]|nr:peptidylprolyl isomerase [Victivallaceae bacterium]